MMMGDHAIGLTEWRGLHAYMLSAAVPRMRTAGDSMLSCKCSSMVIRSDRGSLADRSWPPTCSHSANFSPSRTPHVRHVHMEMWYSLVEAAGARNRWSSLQHARAHHALKPALRASGCVLRLLKRRLEHVLVGCMCRAAGPVPYRLHACSCWSQPAPRCNHLRRLRPTPVSASDGVCQRL